MKTYLLQVNGENPEYMHGHEKMNDAEYEFYFSSNNLEPLMDILSRAIDNSNDELFNYSITPHNHIYKKDRNSTRKYNCECGHSYTPAS